MSHKSHDAMTATEQKGIGDFSKTENKRCSICFHDNYTNPPLDDLEAACGCDCHESEPEEDCEE